MSGDDLRARLVAIDPVRDGGPLAEVPAPTSAKIQERIMSTIQRHENPPAPATSRRPSRPRVLAAIAASLVAVAIGFAIVSTSGQDPSPRSDGSMMVLSAGSGLAASSCLPFDVSVLRDMPVAFAGTATAVEADSVTLTVDRWYRGGSADLVTVASPTGETSIALDGVGFRQGQRYLVTATDATVNGCGYSGPATSELEQAFTEAFPG